MCRLNDELVTCLGCVLPLAQCELGLAPAPHDRARDKPIVDNGWITDCKETLVMNVLHFTSW